MERLIHSDDRDELLRQQGVAQVLINILGMPTTLEAEIVAAQFRIAQSSGFSPTAGNGKLPLAQTTSPEEY